ncbi:hypothetical protein EDB84DRAFT_1442039 [Lactarius hengduanensis]|nr:hypothetical protein EDB84DRAFT_1442039 [Lactarius hengduanensis]
MKAREGTPLPAHHPSSFARKGGARGHATPSPHRPVTPTPPLSASFARDGGTRGHAAPTPRFPLVRATGTPFAQKGGMRGQAAPSHGAPFAREWAHEGKLCRAAGLYDLDKK